MNLKISLPLILLVSACGKQAETTSGGPAKDAPPAVEYTDYAPPAKTYSCRAPARWKAEETSDYGPDEVSFITSRSKGLSMTSRPSSISISISKFPNKSDRYIDAEAYAKARAAVDGHAPAYEITRVSGRTVVRFSRERAASKMHSKKPLYPIHEDVALIVVPSGFFEISHSAPADSYRDTLAVFEEVVRTFQPKS